MKLRMTTKDFALVLSVFILMLVASFLSLSFTGDAVLIILIILSTVLVLIVFLEISRSIQKKHEFWHRKQLQQQEQLYSQIESLFSLFFTLQPKMAFPDMRSYAASPDLLKKIMEVVLTDRPGFVLEASSGVSTLVIAYCLKLLGKGRVVSLEHDTKYATISQQLISSHGLEDIASIVHAPMKVFLINGNNWLWYDKDRIDIEQRIDLLIIDGPPGDLQKLARYPALPLLHIHLSDQAKIILDDGYRDDEKAIAALWEKEFDDLVPQFLALEKGAYLFQKQAPNS